MRFLIIALIFLLFGAFFIVSNENLHLSDKDDLSRFAGLYYDWFGGLFKNLGKITGYIGKISWLPGNQTS